MDLKTKMTDKNLNILHDFNILTHSQEAGGLSSAGNGHGEQSAMNQGGAADAGGVINISLIKLRAGIKSPENKKTKHGTSSINLLLFRQ